LGGFKTAMQLMGIIEHRLMSKPNRLLPDAAVERVRTIVAAPACSDFNIARRCDDRS